MHNPTLSKKTEPQKTANYHTLERVNRLIVDCHGIQDLTNYERILFALYVVLARMGYSSNKFTLAALARRLRALGQGRCLRTITTAQKGLEDKGFIRRRKFRVGPDHFVSIVDFQPRLLSYLSGYRQNLPKVDLTSIRLTPTPRELFNKAPAPAPVVFVNSDKRQKKEHRYHPVIYSLMIVTQGMKHRKQILTRARAEIQTPTLCISGLEWQPIISGWQDRTHEERESFCREVLIPALESDACQIESVGASGRPCAPAQARSNHAAPVCAPSSPIDIRVMLSALESACKFHPLPAPKQKIEKSILSMADLEILSRAKAAAERQEKTFQLGCTGTG